MDKVKHNGENPSKTMPPKHQAKFDRAKQDLESYKKEDCAPRPPLTEELSKSPGLLAVVRRQEPVRTETALPPRIEYDINGGTDTEEMNTQQNAPALPVYIFEPTFTPRSQNPWKGNGSRNAAGHGTRSPNSFSYDNTYSQFFLPRHKPPV